VKHVHKSYTWGYSETPFPAFRAELVFGHNKRDRAFIPVRGVTPVVTYKVTTPADGGHRQVHYEGSDADAAKAVASTFPPLTARIDVSPPTLPENRFRVVRTREGQIMIAEGEDTTNRCLLFADAGGGFRGGVGILEKKGGTTATVLKVVQASNACESTIAVAALLNPGEQLVFWSYGRGTNSVRVYRWDGASITEATYPAREWDYYTSTSDPEENAHVL
jgi:hypothetical protein